MMENPQEITASAQENAGDLLLARKEKELNDLREEFEKFKSRANIVLNILSDRIQTLERQVNTNPTTGLPDRRGLESFIEKRKSQGEGGNFVIMFCDIDQFKLINDTYGHDAGDAVLNAVGERLTKLIQREGDIVSHPHGDEFIVLFEGANEKDILKKISSQESIFNVS
jgi:GGDEF domain-containing protein